MIQQVDQTRLVDDALMRGSRIGLFLQKDAKIENPGPDDLQMVGTSGNILKMLRFPDGTVRFLMQGISRIRIKRFTATTPYLMAEIEELNGDHRARMSGWKRSSAISSSASKQLVELAPYLNEEFHVTAINQDTPSKLVDFVASNLNVAIEQKQAPA